MCAGQGAGHWEGELGRGRGNEKRGGIWDIEGSDGREVWWKVRAEAVRRGREGGGDVRPRPLSNSLYNPFLYIFYYSENLPVS